MRDLEIHQGPGEEAAHGPISERALVVTTVMTVRQCGDGEAVGRWVQPRAAAVVGVDEGVACALRALN